MQATSPVAHHPFRREQAHDHHPPTQPPLRLVQVMLLCLYLAHYKSNKSPDNEEGRLRRSGGWCERRAGRGGGAGICRNFSKASVEGLDFKLRGKRRDMNDELAKQEDEGSGSWVMVLCLLMDLREAVFGGWLLCCVAHHHPFTSPAKKKAPSSSLRSSSPSSLPSPSCMHHTTLPTH